MCRRRQAARQAEWVSSAAAAGTACTTCDGRAVARSLPPAHCSRKLALKPACTSCITVACLGCRICIRSMAGEAPHAHLSAAPLGLSQLARPSSQVVPRQKPAAMNGSQATECAIFSRHARAAAAAACSAAALHRPRRPTDRTAPRSPRCSLMVLWALYMLLYFSSQLGRFVS